MRRRVGTSRISTYPMEVHIMTAAHRKKVVVVGCAAVMLVNCVLAGDWPHVLEAVQQQIKHVAVM